MVELSDVERAVGQILLSFGLVKDSELASYIGKLRVDFPDDDVMTIPEMFKRMNQSLILMGFQIRSLIVQEQVIDENNTEDEDDMEQTVPEDRMIRVTYHGIVNMEEDVTAQKFGTNLKPDELVFFKDCVERLVLNKYQSLHDLVYLSDLAENCRGGWKGDMEALVGRLVDNKWLQRNDKAYIELGPRSHLELRHLIEATTMSTVEDTEDGDEEKMDEARQDMLGQLPQILFY